MIRNNEIVIILIFCLFFSGFAIKDGIQQGSKDILIPFNEIERLHLHQRDLRFGDEPRVVRFSNNGKRLFIAGITTISVFDVETWQLVNKLKIRESVAGRPYNPVCISMDGRLAAVVDFDYIRKCEEIDIWDLESLQKITTLTPPKDQISEISLSPDGKILGCVMVGIGNTWGRTKISLWDVEKRQEIGLIEGTSDREFLNVRDFSFDPSGRFFAICKSDSSYVDLWDVLELKKIGKIEFGSRVGKFSFSPTAKLLAAATERGVVLWDYETNKRINDFRNVRICGMVFGPDGNLITSGGEQGIRLWDIDTGQVLAEFGKYECPYLLALGQKGELATYPGSRGTVFLVWDPGYCMAVLKSTFSPIKGELETTDEFQRRASELSKESNIIKEVARKQLASKLIPIQMPAGLGQYSADTETFTVIFMGRGIVIRATRDLATRLIESRESGGQFFVEGYLKLADDRNFKLVDPVFVDIRTNTKLRL